MKRTKLVALKNLLMEFRMSAGSDHAAAMVAEETDAVLISVDVAIAESEDHASEDDRRMPPDRTALERPL